MTDQGEGRDEVDACFAPGSKLGSKTSKASASSLTAARGSGRVHCQGGASARRALVKGKSYVVTLVAKAPDGRKSTLTVTFKG